MGRHLSHIAHHGPVELPLYFGGTGSRRGGLLRFIEQLLKLHDAVPFTSIFRLQLCDLIKELARLLFRIAEGNGWTKDALSFNTLVTTWPEILEVARAVKKPLVQQGAFDFDEED